MKYNLAIVGATGAVGKKMIETLVSRNFPYSNIDLLASSKSAGKVIEIKKVKIEIKDLAKYNFKNCNIAFFSAGSEVSKHYAPIAEKSNCYVIDNTSCFRMVEDIPLIVPEVNIDTLFKSKRKIISNPNCSTIQMLVALNPIHSKVTKISKVVVSTYQSVSGAGQTAINELEEQTKSILKNKKVSIKKIPKQIAFNVVPQIDIFLENGFTKEEIKMVNETKKILDKSINVNATCVRVPTFTGHAESIYFETEDAVPLSKIEGSFINENGIAFSKKEYHTPIDSAGKEWVFISRLRKDLVKENSFNFWVVSDNLLKGAALNSVQIAEHIVKNRMI